MSALRKGMPRLGLQSRFFAAILVLLGVVALVVVMAWQRQQAARSIWQASSNQALDKRGRNQAAGSIVHQHPVISPCAFLGKRLQPVANALGAAGSAYFCNAYALGRHIGRPSLLAKPVVIRREHQRGVRNIGTSSKRRQRVPKHGAAVNGLVLFGAGSASAAALASAGNQGKNAGSRVEWLHGG